MFLSAFPSEELMAELTAKMFLEVGAVNFRSDEPFRFTSGWASPVYIDCRKLISYPRIRQTLMDFSASMILRNIGFGTQILRISNSLYRKYLEAKAS